MIKKDLLEEKCLELYQSGKKFKVNNGAEVLIPSLPIGTKASRFLRMRDAIAKPEFIDGKDRDCDGKIIQVKNPEHIDLTTDVGMNAIAKMLHEIMSLNYNITSEECDGLFSMAHFDQVITWFYTGQENIGASIAVNSSANRPTQAPEIDGAGMSTNKAQENGTTTRLNVGVKNQEILR